MKKTKKTAIDWPTHVNDLAVDATLPPTTIKFIGYILKPYWKQLAAFFGLSFIGIVFWGSGPFMIRFLINDMSAHDAVTTAAWWWAGLYVAVKLFDELFWRAAEWYMKRVKPHIVENARSKLFAYVLQKPYGYYVNSSSGQIGHWINKTADTLNDLIDHTIWGTWPQIFGLLISAFFLMLASWILALVFVLWMLAILAYNLRRGKTFGKLVELESQEKSRSSGIVVDALANNLSVRIFNSRRKEISHLRSQQQRVIKRWRTSWDFHWVTNAVKGQSIVWVSALSLSIMLWQFGKHQITIGDVALFTAYFSAASTSIWELSWMMDQYYRTFGTIQNGLNGLLKGEMERVVADSIQLPKKTDLELRNVSFSYPEQPHEKVLNSINLHIKAGEKIGIVGHSGAGKTTLVGLLLGFYELTDGVFLVGGDSVQALGPNHLRELIAFVPQDTSLFNRSVLENIQYAKPSATIEQVERAAADAQALEFIKKLPDGFNTLIGERGVKLSGGQRQRVAVARALLKDAPILLLDEATSALDSVSEQAIQKAFNLAMKGRTAIVIAHRLSTLKNLDRIIVLDGGTIAEQGSHESLVELGGIYADLWQRQKDGFIAE